MMISAKAKYLKVAPNKVRQVVNLVRGKPLSEAFAILAHLRKKGSLPVSKLLESALSNAKRQVREIIPEELVVCSIEASEGPMAKRHRAGTMGRAMPILKRSTHLLVSLESIRR